MTVREMIEQTATETAREVVGQMKRRGMVKENKLGTYKKTERALYEFYEWKKREDLTEETKEFCKLIEKALDRVKEDPYFEIIPLKYGEGRTHEKIAEFFDVDVSVISKRRAKLINLLRPVIFSDDFIKELFDL